MQFSPNALHSIAARPLLLHPLQRSSDAICDVVRPSRFCHHPPQPIAADTKFSGKHLNQLLKVRPHEVGRTQAYLALRYSDILPLLRRRASNAFKSPHAGVRNEKAQAGLGFFGRHAPNPILKRRLFVVFGLLVRRRKSFQTLEELFFRHPLHGDLGVVRIDAGAGGADQRDCIRLGFIDFDEFL